MNGPCLLSALGGDTHSTQLLADEGVIALGVEFGVAQYTADESVGMLALPIQEDWHNRCRELVEPTTPR